jgi:PKD repeat protein
VPAWGAEGYSGISGIFGLLPFSDRRPTAAFAATQGAAGVQFDGTGSQSIATIVSYQWDFGDGMTGSGQSATHSYAESGTYLVGLRVINEDGLEATSHQWLEVAEVAEPAAVPVVVISGPLEGSAALVISFPSAIGRNYQLQISGTLAGSGWADTGAVMAGTGGELTVEVAAATAEPVFYRVVVLDTGG